MRAHLVSRYDRLEAVGNRIAELQKASGTFGGRLVDTCAGLFNASFRDDEIALLLLHLQTNAARALPANASAIRGVVEIPEQTFRIWAFWRLGMKPELTSHEFEQLWPDIQGLWASAGLERPTITAHGNLPFQTFASVALARYLKENPHSDEMIPETDLGSLKHALKTHARIRHPAVHAVVVPNRKSREQYFCLVDRWLAATFHASEPPVDRYDLDELVAPLPILTSRGRLESPDSGC